MNPEERQAVRDLVGKLAASEGFEVLRLRVHKDQTIHLMLDRDGAPITLDDCVFINRSLRRALDESGRPKEEWGVEVTSPGLDRPLLTLRHFERFQGEAVRIRLLEPPPQTAVLCATIVAVEGDQIRIQPRTGAERRLKLEQIASARLDPRPPR